MVIGDADGADTAIQTTLFEQGSSNTTVVVYRGGSGPRPRNNVFVNKSKEFMTVGDVAQLQALVARMSEHARHKAVEKLNLRKRIEALSHEQLHMFA